MKTGEILFWILGFLQFIGLFLLMINIQKDMGVFQLIVVTIGIASITMIEYITFIRTSKK